MRTFALALAALLPFASEADSSFGQDCCGTFSPESSVLFPAVGQEFSLSFRPVGCQYYFPSNYPCSYLNTNGDHVVVHNDAEALGVLTNGDVAMFAFTRPRTSSSVGQWRFAETAFGPGMEIVAKVGLVSYPCDLDVMLVGHRGQTWYKYVDYSGLNYGFGLRPDGTPYYPEEPPLWNVRVGCDCTPDPRTMFGFSHTIRIRPYKSNVKFIHAVKDDPMGLQVLDCPACPAASGLGYLITSAVVDGEGASVSFVTEEQPPYDVAVYRMCDIRGDRKSPIAHVSTSNKFATISGSFDGEPVFIQVGRDLGIVSDITPAENKEYVKAVRGTVRGYCCDAPCDKGDFPFVQCGDYRWSAYVPEPSDVIAVGFRGEVAVPSAGLAWPGHVEVGLRKVSIPDYIPQVREVSGQTITNWCISSTFTPATHALRFAHGDDRQYPGYRITYAEASGEFMFEKAYSALPGRSDPWIVERRVIPLSANARKEVFGSDWTGAPGKMIDTNAVPWKIRTANR